MGFGRFVYTPILPFMIDSLGLTEEQAGYIASANFIGYLVGAILAAAPRLPGSRRTWMLYALFFSALTTAAIGLVSTMAAFLALRFLGGVASAFALVFASALVIERLSAAGRSGLSALYFAGVGIGIVVSAVLVSMLAFLDVDWRGQWLASGMISLVATILVYLFIPSAQREPKASPRQVEGKKNGLLALITAYGLFGFGYVITATFLVTIVRGSEAVRSLEPFIWLVVGTAATPSVVLWTWIGAKVGVIRAFAIACVVQALGVAASVLWISPPGIVLAAVLLGGTVMGITSLGLVGARQLSRGDPRQVMALMTAAFGLGQIIGPALAGKLFEMTDSFYSPSLIAAGALVAAAVLVTVQTKNP